MADRDALRAACREFIGAIFEELRNEHVLPTPVFHPYIAVGRDYVGDTVRGVAPYGPLERALEAAFSDRFADQSSLHAEFATSYIFDFLEAAVARCARYDSFDVDCPAVDESIDELIAVLESDSYELVSTRHVAHLTTSTGEEVQIGNVVVVPEPDGFGGLTRRIQQEIKGAARAWAREDPRPYDPPQALLITREISDNKNPYEVDAKLSARLDRFLLVARLLTAGTARSVYELSGATTMIAKMSPAMRMFGSGRLDEMLVRRTVRLTGNETEAFAFIGSLIDDAAVKRTGMIATSFDVALANFTGSYRGDNPYRQLVDLATALEAVLIGAEKETEGLTLRLRVRVATLLATDNDPAEALFNDVSQLYNLRSRLVHGGQIKESDLRKIVGKISTVSTDEVEHSFGVAIYRAVDRMRDLVRRSILARLCLAAEDGPWPFVGETLVDAILTDDRKRLAWRARWHDHLASLGVAYAASRPRSAVSFISQDDR